MGLLKGSVTMTRYRVTQAPPDDLTDEFVSERLIKNSFIDIEHAPEEKSLGWVELSRPLETGFNPASYRFGGIIAFTLRLDTRKLAGKTVARYYAIREAEYEQKMGRRPNSLGKKELKEAVRGELLRRSLVNTELMEVAWLYGDNEIWLGAQGEKRREVFEELWQRTFGLSLQMLVPVTIGLELMPDKNKQKILDSKPSAIWGEGLGGDSER